MKNDIQLESEINNIVKRCAQELIQNKKTLAIAESCTGGLLSHLITQQSGASKYLLIDVVSYSNLAKSKFLNVPESALIQFGAVSSQVVSYMATGVRELISADYSIGITGIAGPTGGTQTKPVGLVFVSVTSKNKTVWKEYRFTDNNRKKFKLETARAAFSMLENLLTINN